MTGCADGPLGSDPWTSPPVLGFPVAAPAAVESLAAYGTPNWSGTEPHNGVDLVLNTAAASVMIKAPCKGTVTKIEVKSNSYSNPPGQMLLTVEITVNLNWVVSLNLEPGTVDDALKKMQEDAIKVSVGQKLYEGDDIGLLFRGEQGHTHLHYMIYHKGGTVCAYSVSSDEAKSIFDSISAYSGTNPCY